MRGIPIALAFVVAGCLRVPGQDALRSALSLDTALARQENPPAHLPPDMPHLGPVPLSLGTYLGASYDDNVFESDGNPQADVILRGGIDIGVLWPATERSQVQLSTELGYLHYVSHSQYSGFEVSPNSALAYSISYGELAISCYDQFNYWREVATEGALVDIATLPRLDNTIGTRVTWKPGHWLGEFGCGYENFLSNQANDYLDRSTEDFFGRWARAFAEKSQVGFEASGSLTAYRIPVQSDNRSVSAGPYVDWQLRPSLHLTLRGGPTYYFFENRGRALNNPTLNSYYVGASVSQQLSDFLSHSINVRHDVEPGLNASSDYIEQWSLGYSLSYALTQHVTLGATITYENGLQPLPLLFFGPYVFEVNEHYELYGAGPQVSWRFTDKLTASLTYLHWQRQSNLVGRNFGENNLSVSVNYSF